MRNPDKINNATKNSNISNKVMENFELMNNQNKSKQIKTNQNKSKQIKTNQNKSKQIKTNQNKSKQIKTNQNKSKQIKTNQNKSNQIKSNQIKSNQIKSNQIKSNQIKSNQIKSNQIKSNQIKSNQIKSKTFLLATLCVAAALLSCKKDDKVDPVDTQVVADFTFTQGTAGAVTFKNASKNATSYAWDFGDGNKATEENPTHTYTKDSTYTVKLTATNADGSADKTATVTIDNTVTTAPITIDIADLTQLVLPKNSPDGVVIWKIAATVANSDESPVYSIKSQNPAGVLGLKGNKIMLADASAVDYDTNTELTGEIQAAVGSVMATAAFTISITDGAGIYIPDAEFKEVLVNNTALNTNGDQEISATEAQAYAGSIVGVGGDTITIKDATGIEYFTKVTNLNLSNNALTALNLSQNTALTDLNVDRNNLTELDVSQNTALIQLFLSGNQLTVIDVSDNTALSWLYLDANQLTAIDVSQNTVLGQLQASSNNLTDIDVSQNTNLFLLFLKKNDLKKVNLANGNNTKLTNLNLSDNPDLTCVQVDDPANIPSAWEGKYDKDKVKFQTKACQ